VLLEDGLQMFPKVISEIVFVYKNKCIFLRGKQNFSLPFLIAYCFEYRFMSYFFHRFVFRQLSILVKERHEAFSRLKTLEDLMDALRKENELLRHGLAATPTPDKQMAAGSEG
jgi:hypothetical protein